ncbi:hypothetical protein [Mucilaginibacter polytrichastri]|uniref:Uncharacterized protein n=1 Tax=Mucilaginibacter polytrichastri TaxID=1302689 RepID=A0A1Q5ZRW8_9SPHI|nr:hypothetical protein [Mucilaginibacter polytrichastri]OKS84504.1 hypothetical protein RG47T_5267 [Mucilaginibacter polytrichastri]SFT02923.1 hypothetical protein SAMN04487890_108236 [Mucilaginibacter polytrichastri]SFT23636.1 hypothetical protein SAMN04487890_1219 [Mucilaginibacter polytrichastri]SFT27718.1 hypothetical protein SAMN04487890_13312 [Mucilaginibacter polytrichastri]
MKTAFYFICTCFISTGFCMAAISSKTPEYGILSGLGIWALFLWGCKQRAKKSAAKREQERLFEEFLRRRFDHRDY